ncbi:hypothetical protein [Gemella morbillorum]|uniref:hypothetical protein n=1 Tax=Gemella morbillorum TaxID=29391 RepID=UPI0028D79B90|nr:hypothetical protein [Gemella morbillorum]
MKKLLMILATIILSISILGCSSSSKKYDSDINKILEYINKDRLDSKKQLERKNVNIEVYDVNYNLDRIKGQHNTYKITFPDKKDKPDTDVYLINKENKVVRFSSGDESIVANMLQKKVYEENNNKNLKAEF